MDEEKFFKNRRGKWSHKDVPHKGWVCFEIEDTEDTSQLCEMCESQSIRYIHHMRHPNYKQDLAVGCICAGHMEENLIAASIRDDFMKSRSNKRKKWITRKWKVSSNGNDYIKSDGYLVIIFKRNNSWCGKVSRLDGSYEQYSKRNYSTKEQVKMSSFDFITKRLSEDINR